MHTPAQPQSLRAIFSKRWAGGVWLVLLSLATLFTGCTSGKSDPQPAQPTRFERIPLVSHDPSIPPSAPKRLSSGKPVTAPATPAKTTTATISQTPKEDAPIVGPTLSGLVQYDATFDAAVQLLRDYGFTIDRQDYRFGLVTTRPLVSPTIFEPWRTTNTSAGQMAQGTLNSQRRIVRVAIKPITLPISPTTKYQLTVQVTLIKLQQPLKHLNGSTSGFSIVSNYSAVPAEWKEKGITRAYWIPDGSDPLLAQRIIDDVSKRAGLK